MLAELFPDRNVEAVAADDDLASALDLDSLAMIDFALEIERRVGLHIPDEDLEGLTTIGASVAYVTARRAPAP
jgi:acyl carrier protein